jgi:hypothetical protein
MNSFADDSSSESLARSLALYAWGVVGIVLLIAMFVAPLLLAPSASAAGGCGGG